MKLNEIRESSHDEKLDPSVNQKMGKVRRAFATELKRFDRTAKVTEDVIGPFEVYIFSELNKFMRDVDMEALWEDARDAIRAADLNGHIHSLEEHGTGLDFVAAILSGLKPGMKVNAEAFFPTIGFHITWKQVVTAKRR